MTPDLRIRGLSGALNAEIQGLDLSRPLSGADRTELLSALHHDGVLCIRDQKLTYDSHIALAKHFGAPDIHPIANGLEAHPEIIPGRKPAGEEAFFGISSHSDNSFFERPSRPAVLCGGRVPPVGDDTRPRIDGTGLGNALGAPEAIPRSLARESTALASPTTRKGPAMPKTTAPLRSGTTVGSNTTPSTITRTPIA
ncbi:MAG: hypothetical protein GY910_06990 [bacterium]|nr:hypothetical protein [Deltaproteobacteria bacterium]MCP4904710.1 hypothetical protein [bacterium]